MAGAENVVKQGYLKKGNAGGNRLSGLFRRNESKWFVFTVRLGVPYLEYFDNDTDVFTQPPINSFNLSTCRSVKAMGASNPPSFCVVSSERVIELVAASRTQMVEWVTEMDASLVRLGIIKKEVVDHVYTVCPAVVRKPRVSKEVLEEREAAEEEAVSSARPAVSSVESAVIGASSTDGASRLQREPEQLSPPVVTPRSISPHGMASGNQQDDPPPLPWRPPPQLPVRRASQKGSQEDTQVKTENEISEGDDDIFASSELIMRLLKSRVDKVESISPSVESAEASASGAGTSENTFRSTSSGHLQKPITGLREKPDLKPKPASLRQTNHNVSSSTENLYSSSSSLLSSEAPPDPELTLDMPALFPGKVDCVENPYSIMPGEVVVQNETQESAGQSERNQAVTKPIPRPRRALSQKCQVYDNNFSGINPSQPSENGLELHTAQDEHSQNVAGTEISSIVCVETEGSSKESGTPQESSNLVGEKRNAETVDRSNQQEEKVKEEVVGSVGEAKEIDKTSTSLSSKDENENFYGLMFDLSCPPTTHAPPIPPLPPRHDSLTHWANLGHPTTTAERHGGTSSSTSQSVTTMSTSVSSSSSSATSILTTPPSSAAPTTATAFVQATAGSQPPLPLSSPNLLRIKSYTTGNTEVAPPLPLPRKKGNDSDSLRKSFPIYPRSLNHSLDIPPTLPARPVPKRSITIEDKPPALPSRQSQSFQIKRPQLTAFGSNTDAAVSAGSEARSKTLTLPAEGALSKARVQEGSLSRKMLLDRAHSMHTVVSLKQTQAEILQTEIGMSSVSVTLTQKSGHGLALVDYDNFPCVVGWNQKDFPSLHGKLHIGDLLFSINSVKVNSSDMAQKLLKQSGVSKIEVMVHRMPYARVFAIRRNAEGQSLGIKREGGTGEIVYVDPNGLAAQHNLPQHAPSAQGQGRCNWFITEVNNRPLSLFFKENEIDHRLAAVGREISIVVQPCDFINEIRKQFKKIKNYKNYIIY